MCFITDAEKHSDADWGIECTHVLLYMTTPPNNHFQSKTFVSMLLKSSIQVKIVVCPELVAALGSSDHLVYVCFAS